MADEIRGNRATGRPIVGFDRLRANVF